MVKDGHRAVMFYLMQRQDCKGFALAKDIDPTYAEAFAVARKMGVEILCYDCHITTNEIELGTAHPLIE
jgi:sugar fermentation stimulation protein A